MACTAPFGHETLISCKSNLPRQVNWIQLRCRVSPQQIRQQNQIGCHLALTCIFTVLAAGVGWRRPDVIFLPV